MTNKKPVIEIATQSRELTPAEVVANMSSKERMRCFRQLFFNETDMTKQSIRGMIAGIVREQIQVVIKESPDLFDPDSIVRKVFKHDYRLSEDIRTRISNRVISCLQVDVDVTTQSVKVSTTGRKSSDAC